MVGAARGLNRGYHAAQDCSRTAYQVMITRLAPHKVAKQVLANPEGATVFSEAPFPTVPLLYREPVVHAARDALLPLAGCAHRGP